MHKGSKAVAGAVAEGRHAASERIPRQPATRTAKGLYPTLRANPFPEVTDLLCLLPLSTLLYRPEADHLGDLMRL